MAAGKSWSEKDKELFKNPYSQYVRLETDFTKTWQLGLNSQLAAHVNAGAMWTYGNSMYGTFSEAFYVGGANSIRAFPIRSIGPGALSDSEIEKALFFAKLDNNDIDYLKNIRELIVNTQNVNYKNISKVLVIESLQEEM